MLCEYLPGLKNKRVILQHLQKLLSDVNAEYDCSAVLKDISSLSEYQTQLMESCLLPQQNEMWLKQKIKPLWQSIVASVPLASVKKKEIANLLEKLRQSFHVGLDKQIRDRVDTIPETLKAKWVDLAYREINGSTNGLIN